jgi:hypothetical protein
LLGAKVGAVEDLLQADDLGAGGRGLADEGDMLFDHGLFLCSQGLRGRDSVGGLNDGTSNNTGHGFPQSTRKSCESLKLIEKGAQGNGSGAVGPGKGRFDLKCGKSNNRER